MIFFANITYPHIPFAKSLNSKYCIFFSGEIMNGVFDSRSANESVNMNFINAIKTIF
jgi:hypothetical protein